ncbi:MAG: hypothetical protein MJ124_09125 [Lachnospiraceae bacterium]|nr:hypothetical protein [Lachnospiraceae bacterium]
MSYIPCDEGIYKKYLEAEDAEFVSGIEYVIDVTVGGMIEGFENYDNEADALRDVAASIDDAFYEKLASRFDQASNDNDVISLTKKDLLLLLSASGLSTLCKVERILEMERGEVLVSSVDSKFASFSSEEMTPYYEESAAEDKLIAKITEDDGENYVWNANGKLRPVWDKGFRRQGE